MTDSQRAKEYAELMDTGDLLDEPKRLSDAFLAGLLAEREECAKVAEEYCDSARDLYHDTDRVIRNTADGIAGLIRARGKEEA